MRCLSQEAVVRVQLACQKVFILVDFVHIRIALVTLKLLLVIRTMLALLLVLAVLLEQQVFPQLSLFFIEVELLSPPALVLLHLLTILLVLGA